MNGKLYATPAVPLEKEVPMIGWWKDPRTCLDSLENRKISSPKWK